MKRKNLHKFLFTFILIFLASYVIARPGGGHSYSGGSSGFSSYSDGEGGGDLFMLLFYILPPEISIPIAIVIFIYFLVKKFHKIYVILSILGGIFGFLWMIDRITGKGLMP